MEPLFTTGGAERAGLGFAVMESFMDSVKVRSAPVSYTHLDVYKRQALGAAGFYDERGRDGGQCKLLSCHAVHLSLIHI